MPYNSFERTETVYGAARLRRAGSGRTTFETLVHFRKHRDRFVLFRDNPAAYTNNHATRRVGLELRTVTDLGLGFDLALATDGVYEDLRSTGIRGGSEGPALGDEERRRSGVSAELTHHFRNLRWQLGLRMDLRSDTSARVTYSAAAAWDASSRLTLRSSLGSSFRAPTFTELYYEDPSNLGNPDSRPEESWTWDAGWQLHDGPWSASWTVFERRESDMLDWARDASLAALDPALPWRLLNISDGFTRGTETTVGWSAPRGHRLSLNYARLEKSSSLDPGFEGKYGLIAPKDLLAAAGTVALKRHVSVSVAGRYRERTGGPDDHRIGFVLDGRVNWRLRGVTFTAQGTNLLDREYEDIPGVRMPGRLFTLGFSGRI